MSSKPFAYQRECALLIESFGGRALLAMDMGTGKTLTSLLWAKWNPQARPIVIVCPASLKWNWQKECRLHFGWHAEVLEGRKPRKLDKKLTDIWILNYDILSDWLEALKELEPQLVILDESVAIKERRAQRSKAAKNLCHKRPHVLALSGTPLTTKPADLWHTLHVLRPDLYRNFHSFAILYCDPKYTQWGWKYDGASNLLELHELLTKQLLIRKRKDEVLKDLPPKLRSVIPLPIKNPSQYRQAREEFKQWLKTYHPEKSERSLKAAQMTKLGYLKRLAAQLKLAAVKDWIDDFLLNSSEKLILFAIHKAVISELSKQYKKICTVVDGSVTSQNRQKAFDRFAHDSKIRILIGNIQAAGTGWNGVVASTVAFCELGWTSAEHVQCEDRAHRIGQKQTVNAVYLVAQGTIEESLCGLLQARQGYLDQILDGQTYSEGMDIYDQLCEQLCK